MADNENYEPVTTEPDSELGKMLYALNGNPVDVPYPTSEFTTILYALLGYEIEVPEPTSEASRLLYQYYIGGGGSGDYQAKNIEPDFSNGNVVVVPDSGYDALSRVVIEKDAALLASNIKKDIEIFGITGNYDGPTIAYQSKSIQPDMSEGDVTVEPDDGYDGLSSVTITKDPYLIAENIKKDVEIFGITGTLENTVPQDLQDDMNSVFNKKFSTTTTYAPNTWADTVNLMGKLPEKTASGAIASFNDGADDVPIVSGIFDIVAQQAGTGDPSPDNIRAITGFTGCNIVKSGKNLLAKSFIFNDNDDLNSLSECFFIKAGAYVFSFGSMTNATSWRFLIRLKDANGNDLNTSNYITVNSMSWSSLRKGWLNNANITSKRFSFTLNQDCFIRILFGVGDTSVSSVASDPQLELGAEPTTYEPYTATTYNIDWTTEAGTVYGGTLNATTGVLTVTSQRYNLADLTWTVATQGFYQATKPEEMARCDASVVPDIIAEKYIAQTGQWVYAHGSTVGYIGQNGGLLYVTDSTTPSGYIVAPLITPITYQLTPTQINTLLGANNIYCDTGDSSVTYRADIDLALQNL